MSEVNCPTKCGGCCVISSEIPLTFREVVSGRYATQDSRLAREKRHDEIVTENGLLSSKVLREVEKYIPSLGYSWRVCTYFDPRAMKCMIYERRPLVCRTWHCDFEWAKGLRKERDRIMGPKVEECLIRK